MLHPFDCIWFKSLLQATLTAEVVVEAVLLPSPDSWQMTSSLLVGGSYQSHIILLMTLVFVVVLGFLTFLLGSNIECPDVTALQRAYNIAFQ